MFFVVQLATMLILWTGANTPFNGFPYLANFVAADGFLPRWLTKRGHRLAFSNGIIVLAVIALALILGTGAHVDELVAFYAIGVFTGFTLAGFGMARYFTTHREGRWRAKVIVNTAVGAVAGAVVLIFAVTKFTEGAWLVVVVFPLLVVLLLRLRRTYQEEAALLKAVPDREITMLRTSNTVLILVDKVDLAVLRAHTYARSLRPASLRAVHFSIDVEHARALQQAWDDMPRLDLPLEVVDCPDRRLGRAALELAERTLHLRPSGRSGHRAPSATAVRPAARAAPARPHRRRDRRRRLPGSRGRGDDRPVRRVDAATSGPPRAASPRHRHDLIVSPRRRSARPRRTG